MTRKVVFLCSGGGGNLKFVHAASRAGWLGDGKVTNIIADRECPALDFARAHGINAVLASFSAEGQIDIARMLADIEPAVIVTNVHKILIAEVIHACPSAPLNLHYSLLPAFSAVVGARPVKQALAYGAKFVGVTAHHVVEAVDMGPPISQCAIAVEPADSDATLMDTVFRAGCICLLTAIERVLSIEAQQGPRFQTLRGHDVFFNPAPGARDEFQSEAFWQQFSL